MVTVIGLNSAARFLSVPGDYPRCQNSSGMVLGNPMQVRIPLWGTPECPSIHVKTFSILLTF